MGQQMDLQSALTELLMHFRLATIVCRATCPLKSLKDLTSESSADFYKFLIELCNLGVSFCIQTFLMKFMGLFRSF